nr:cytidylate kinase family protein [Desulfosarcina cetonica]
MPTRTRIKLVQRRQQISREEAERLIGREDQERAEWYRSIYRIDMNDPRLYDVLLHIGRLTIDDACDTLCRLTESPSFQTTPQSLTALSDLAVENRVKVALAGVCKAEVRCREGIVHLRVEGQKLIPSGAASPSLQHQVQDQIRDDVYQKIVGIVSAIPGVKDIDCAINTPYFV